MQKHSTIRHKNKSPHTVKFLDLEPALFALFAEFGNHKMNKLSTGLEQIYHQIYSMKLFASYLKMCCSVHTRRWYSCDQIIFHWLLISE